MGVGDDSGCGGDETAQRWCCGLAFGGTLPGRAEQRLLQDHE